MTFGLLWLSSIIMSNFMLVVSVFRAIKDLADEGYKLNVENINNKPKVEDSNIPTFLILLVPIANILYTLNFSVIVVQNKNALFNAFRIRNMIKEMTDEEKEEYRKNPTLLNAFKISAKIDNYEKVAKEKEKENLTFKLSFENIEGQIEYTLENNEVKIISSTVDSNKYNIKSQENLICATLKLVYERILKNFTNKEELNKYMLSHPRKIKRKIENYKVTSEDEDKFKKYYLEYEILDKFNEAMENKNEAERLEKEELTSEKLEMINRLKSKYKELMYEITKINSYLFKLNNEENEAKQKNSEEKLLKK